MVGDKVDRQVKSFSLKVTNVDKVEKIAYEKKRKQSAVVDKMIEEFEDGDR